LRSLKAVIKLLTLQRLLSVFICAKRSEGLPWLFGDDGMASVLL
jgi:hypothetical protein